MANSTSTSLKLTVQATGENSGTWGQITNTNLLILEQAIGGYDAVAITTGATLVFTNGALSNGKNKVLKLTGTIAGAVNVVIPDSIEKTFVVDNATSGSHAVTFKTSSGTGVTWAAADKGTKMVYSDGTNVVDTAFTELSSDFSPQLSADLDTNSQNIIIDDAHNIQDENGNEQLVFQTTGSAINEFELTNSATGNAPQIAVTGDDSNIDMNITPKGVGRATFNGQGKIQSVAEKVTTSATAATGTINYDVLTQAVLNFTSNAAGNYTLNIRGDGSNSLDSIMDTGESITIAHLVPQGGSAYYNNAVTIDGVSITPEWQGGSAPSAGNASSIDVYSYTIIKTGSATFTALASQTQFA
tara:strand:+ start:1253 stop:2323 length:1071 start_codon:yes stop_codon:yes gene_type:complete